MRDNGWYDKKGVTILEGKGQDHTEALHIAGFDVVYTDTFSEDYVGESDSKFNFVDCLLTLTLYRAS